MTKSEKKIDIGVKAKVYVLYTGGTFGMAKDLSTPGHPLRAMALDKLRDSLADVNALAQGTEITLESFPHSLDSSSMQPRDWEDIAKRIEANYDTHDGFVIIQGTDTLAYTASALSFIFENLSKPVIITGSQLPLEHPRTDAFLNYGHSLMIAAYKATDLPKIPEVIVVFADKILRGCRTQKMSASSWAGFDSPNCPVLGEIGEHVRIYENQLRSGPSTGLGLKLNIPLVTDVLDISLFPGLKANHLEQMLSFDDISGVVLRTYGTGNAPEDEPFLKALGQGMRRDNKIVVNVTQCPQGAVEMGLYAASVGLLENGVISGSDMTPEAALTKLMVSLRAKVPEQVKLQMQVNLRGEQDQNIFDLNFKATKQSDKYSDKIVPDSRFDPNALRTVVLRVKNVKITAEKGATFPIVDVFMNAPSSSVKSLDDSEHPKRIYRITPILGSNFDVVETLNQDIIRSIIGDNDISITFVASKGVSFSFDKLSLSLFTQAH